MRVLSPMGSVLCFFVWRHLAFVLSLPLAFPFSASVCFLLVLVTRIYKVLAVMEDELQTLE